MNKHVIRAIALSLAVALPSVASAQIDQFNTNNSTASGQSDYVRNYVGQTFKPMQSFSSGAGIWLAYYPNGTNGLTSTFALTATLYTAPNGTLIAGGTATATTVQGNPSVASWYDVAWSGGPVAVTAGTSYFVTFGSNETSALSLYYNGSSDPYLDGQMYLYNGSNYVFSDAGCGAFGAEIGNQPGCANDLVFREYGRVFTPTATPEPASVILLGTGLVGIAGIARRRNKNKK